MKNKYLYTALLCGFLWACGSENPNDQSESEIINEKTGISAEMAMKLSKALGGSPQFWLNLQNNWELSQLNETSFQSIERVAA